MIRFVLDANTVSDQRIIGDSTTAGSKFRSMLPARRGTGASAPAPLPSASPFPVRIAARACLHRSDLTPS
jgi:hypothetical protein